MLVKMPASKWPSFPASGGALGATSALSPSPQVLEEPEFSLVLVLEVAAFLVGLVQFLGLEALEVVSVPAGGGGVLEKATGKGLTLCGCLSRGRGCWEGGCKGS